MLPTSHHPAGTPAEPTPSATGTSSITPVTVARWAAERGAGLVEYALLMALVAVVVISAVVFFGGSTNENLNKSSDTISGT
jgi:Flp pilus assembly pilin Flp